MILLHSILVSFLSGVCVETIGDLIFYYSVLTLAMGVAFLLLKLTSPPSQCLLLWFFGAKNVVKERLIVRLSWRAFGLWHCECQERRVSALPCGEFHISPLSLTEVIFAVSHSTVFSGFNMNKWNSAHDRNN